jgi:hypothetical protein
VITGHVRPLFSHKADPELFLHVNFGAVGVGKKQLAVIESGELTVALLDHEPCMSIKPGVFLSQVMIGSQLPIAPTQDSAKQTKLVILPLYPDSQPNDM